MIVINFKNYVSGEKSLELAEKIENYLPMLKPRKV